MHLAKKVLILLFLLAVVPAYAYYDYGYDNYGGGDYYYAKPQPSLRNSHYEAVYMDPPKRGIDVYGRYIISTGSVRYVHSASKLKRAAHAARISAENRMYGNY